MKLTAEREKLLAPLQAVIGVVERRQTMPVLANVLLGVRQGQLSITATDLEVELVAATEVTVQQAGDITVPGRKFLDILRALPEKAAVSLSVEGEKVVIKAGRSRFSLSTLPAAEFPVIDDINSQQTVQIAAQGIAAAAGEDAFFDGAAGRALLLERHAARDRRPDAARGGDRWSSFGAVRSARWRRRRRPRNRSSCRAKACWSCSGC